METKTKWIIGVIIIVLAIAGGGYWLYNSQHAYAVKLDTFAQCINDSGAKFYGAFWCPHCQNQKAEFETVFESAVSKLPYIECSTPNSSGQLDVCKKEEIKVYPTWKFADGSKNEGEVTFENLAEKTGCALPVR